MLARRLAKATSKPRLETAILTSKRSLYTCYRSRSAHASRAIRRSPNPARPFTASRMAATPTISTSASNTPSSPPDNEPLTPTTLTANLQTRLTPTPIHIQIHDMSGGCGSAFSALIVSDGFVGKGALARHRAVNAALKEEIRLIHAWTPRCLTGEEWEREKEREKLREGGGG